MIEDHSSKRSAGLLDLSRLRGNVRLALCGGDLTTGLDYFGGGNIGKAFVPSLNDLCCDRREPITAANPCPIAIGIVGTASAD